MRDGFWQGTCKPPVPHNAGDECAPDRCSRSVRRLRIGQLARPLGSSRTADIGRCGCLCNWPRQQVGASLAVLCVLDTIWAGESWNVLEIQLLVTDDRSRLCAAQSTGENPRRKRSEISFHHGTTRTREHVPNITHDSEADSWTCKPLRDMSAGHHQLPTALKSSPGFERRGEDKCNCSWLGVVV